MWRFKTTKQNSLLHSTSALNNLARLNSIDSSILGLIITVMTKSMSFNDNNYIKKDKTISPWFVSGLTDAEGCFTCSIVKNKTSRFGYSLNLAFQIESHVRDFDLLQSIQEYFQIGSIVKINNREICQYRVRNKKELQIIICHFYKYPLLTSKRIDFYLFSILYNLLSNKIETVEDFLYCLAIINNINKKIKPDKLRYLIESLEGLNNDKSEYNKKLNLPTLILPPINYYDPYLINLNPY
jgi:LAGLIDADG endonuclease